MTINRLAILTRRGSACAPAILVASALSLCSIPVLAQTPPERLSDNQVKTLIDQVDEGRDKFEGNLDSKFKASTLRGPSGERKVEDALQDYQDNTKKLQHRFTSDYAATEEVAVVLKQSNAIGTFMQGSPSLMKGRPEWDRQTVNLKHLAEAYGTTFPIPDGATTRRTNDNETAGAAAAIADAADRFKDDIDDDKGLPKSEREAAKKDVEVLIKLADAVKDRTNDGKSATAELRQLVEQVAIVQTFVGVHPMPTLSNWQALQTSLVTLRRAFGLPM
jgi:hypothetical protein